MHVKERQERLYAIAEEDTTYQVWKQGYEDRVKAFQTYAYAQPENIRDILFGYADAGRMMVQRIVGLACEHMDFIDDVEDNA